MLVSDLTNHFVRSGVDLLLSLLTVPQKLHSRQYGIHSKRMITHVNSSWVSRHLGEGKVSSWQCSEFGPFLKNESGFGLILGWTRLMSIVFSLGKSFALIPQCVFSIIDLSPHLIVWNGHFWPQKSQKYKGNGQNLTPNFVLAITFDPMHIFQFRFHWWCTFILLDA